jgi:hypothetical protein
LSCDTSEDSINQNVYFLIAGQSNAMGVGDKEKSPYETNLDVLEYNSKLDDLVYLKDPVGEFHLGFQKAQTGSFIPSLAYTYNHLTGNNVLVVQAAKGGSALTVNAEINEWGNWSPTGELFSKSITKIKMMQSCINSNNLNKPQLNAIFWCQGENDGEAIANGKITKQEYRDALVNLINRYYLEFGKEIPFIIIETGKPSGSVQKINGFKEIREAQREVAQEKLNVYIGYNETEFFNDRDWLKDNVHYNQKALNHIGVQLAHFYRSLTE